MRIEIHLDELNRLAKHKIGEEMVVKALTDEFRRIAQKHRQNMLKELDDLIAKFTIKAQHEWGLGVTKVIISDGQDEPQPATTP